MSNKMKNPVKQVQAEIAELLASTDYFKKNRVEIIEQDSQGLKFLLSRSAEQLRGVVLVVGVDEMTNDYPALEVTVTITCLEYVLINRSGSNSETAIDVCQRAIFEIDGEKWHFDSMRHEAPESGVLQATATFRGLVEREKN